MLNRNLKPKYGLIIAFIALSLLFGLNTVSAETISLKALIDTDIWDEDGKWDWSLGKDFFISANATGINIGQDDAQYFQDLYGAALKFEFVAEGSFNGTEYTGYSGFFKIIDENDTVYLSAKFDTLTLNYRTGSRLSFSTEDISGLTGSLTTGIFSDMTVSLTYGRVKDSSFIGSIRLDEDESSATGDDPIANPEPGTFFLLGFGMLGLARLYRRKNLT